MRGSQRQFSSYNCSFDVYTMVYISFHSACYLQVPDHRGHSISINHLFSMHVFPPTIVRELPFCACRRRKILHLTSESSHQSSESSHLTRLQRGICDVDNKPSSVRKNTITIIANHKLHFMHERQDVKAVSSKHLSESHMK